MFKLINSKDARLLSIKNIFRKLDMGIRDASEVGLTSFKTVIPTNTAFEIQERLGYEGYTVKVTTLPQQLTQLIIIWG